MEQRTINGWLAAWEVIRYVEDEDENEEEQVVARYKDPWKAAEFCCENHCSDVRLGLFKPEFNLPTID